MEAKVLGCGFFFLHLKFCNYFELYNCNNTKFFAINLAPVTSEDLALHTGCAPGSGLSHNQQGTGISPDSQGQGKKPPACSSLHYEPHESSGKFKRKSLTIAILAKLRHAP